MRRQKAETLGLTVDILWESELWPEGFRAWAQDAADALDLRLILPDACEAVILAADDARLATLNAEFRARHQATNVLSWPSAERAPDREGAVPEPPSAEFPGDGPSLGDVALAYETCAREAMEQGKSLEDHAKHLVIHGLLHLLGYDHERDADADLMECLEVEILHSLGVSDPYIGVTA